MKITMEIMNNYLKLNQIRIKLLLRTIKAGPPPLEPALKSTWDRIKTLPFTDKGSEIMANGT
jgi:hypothetical protein